MTDGTQETHVIMALCNQLEAFTSDLGDDQSPYVLVFIYRKLCFQSVAKSVTLNGPMAFITHYFA